MKQAFFSNTLRFCRRFVCQLQSSTSDNDLYTSELNICTSELKLHKGSISALN